MLDGACWNFYMPFDHSAIYETIVLFERDVAFKQYVPKEHKLFGIKIYSLWHDWLHTWHGHVPYFLAHKTRRPIRRTVIFSLEILEKNDECILILVIYWKKTGLLHTKINNHNIIYSS